MVTAKIIVTAKNSCCKKIWEISLCKLKNVSRRCCWWSSWKIIATTVQSCHYFRDCYFISNHIIIGAANYKGNINFHLYLYCNYKLPHSRPFHSQSIMKLFINILDEETMYYANIFFCRGSLTVLYGHL